jgi:hypothetical protein
VALDLGVQTEEGEMLPPGYADELPSWLPMTFDGYREDWARCMCSDIPFRRCLLHPAVRGHVETPRDLPCGCPWSGRCAPHDACLVHDSCFCPESLSPFS